MKKYLVSPKRIRIMQDLDQLGAHSASPKRTTATPASMPHRGLPLFFLVSVASTTARRTSIPGAPGYVVPAFVESLLNLQTGAILQSAADHLAVFGEKLFLWIGYVSPSANTWGT
jgi:hypothetical protein